MRRKTSQGNFYLAIGPVGAMSGCNPLQKTQTLFKKKETEGQGAKRFRREGRRWLKL